LKVAFGILTYGDRSELLSEVIDQIQNLGNFNIFIFGNDVSSKSKNKLLERYGSHANIKCIFSENNLGSAGGYKKLIEIMKSDTESILFCLLDDDNLLSNNFFDVLAKLDINTGTIYAIDRVDRPLPRASVAKRNPAYLMGPKNGFLGRSILKSYDLPDKNTDLLAAPYGGLVLTHAALHSGVLPKSKYFLYADDYDYTYRLYRDGNFCIKFIDQTVIHDLEKSFHVANGKNKRTLSNRFSNANKTQIYYSVRNQIWFTIEKDGVNALLLFNTIIFAMIYVAQFALLGDLGRAKVFIEGLIDGYKKSENV
jgi:GT2 family glycosyltransferase